MCLKRHKKMLAATVLIKDFEKCNERTGGDDDVTGGGGGGEGGGGA